MKRKILLLGPEKSGKSTLVQRIVFDEYSEEYSVTLGASATIDEKTNIFFWDTGGQKIFQSIVHTFIAQSGGNFCIVFDPSNFEESIAQCNYWLAEIINKYAGTIRIQFVVTKCDLEQEINTIKYEATDAEGNITNLTGQAAITAQLKQISAKFDPNLILPNIVFCSAKDPTKGTDPSEIITNVFPEEIKNKNNDDLNSSKLWSAKKCYSWGKNFLMLAIFLMLSFILTNVFQNDSSANTLIGINLAFFAGTALFLYIAVCMFASAFITKVFKGDPGKNSTPQSHPIQIGIKAIVVATFVGILGAIASSNLVLPAISPVLQATQDAFSHINLTGLQTTLPSELASTFAIIFLAAISYFVIDTLFRIYNSRWDDYTPDILPSTSSPALHWLFNLGYDAHNENSNVDSEDVAGLFNNLWSRSSNFLSREQSSNSLDIEAGANVSTADVAPQPIVREDMAYEA